MPDETDNKPADDEKLTWAGNKPLSARWWWSGALMVVVGIAVIGYQSSALMAPDGGIALNWVMVAVGAAVIVYGVVQLKGAYAAEQAKDQAAGPSAPPPR